MSPTASRTKDEPVTHTVFSFMRRALAETTRMALGAVVLAPACVSLVPPADLEGLESGALDPCRVVFVVEGMLHDLGAAWDEKLQEEFEDEGLCAVRVRYFTSPLGVWFNWGSVAPAAELAKLADEITLTHAASGCARPLELYGVGFSHGCEVWLRALRSMDYARLQRLALMHSSSFAWSYQLDRLVEEGRVIEPVRHWSSAIDGTTILAPLGAGTFGLRSRTGAVIDEHHYMFHLARLISPEFRREVLEFVTEPELAPSAPEPTAERDAYARDLRSILERLEAAP